MSDRIAVTGNSATWRRGMQAVLSDAGYAVTLVDSLDGFRAGEDGSILLVGLNSKEIPTAVVNAVEDNPFVPVVVVVPEIDLLHFAEGLRLGVAGIVDEHVGDDVLVTTIAGAAGGLLAVPRALGQSMAQLVPEPESRGELLSDTQLAWLRAMASGSTVADLAEEWGYSERAMFRNLKALYIRVGVSNRTEALLWASRQSLLDPELD